MGSQVYFHIFQSAHYQGGSGAGAVTAGVWSHIAGTWDGTTMKLYINGVLSGTTALSGPIASNTEYYKLAG